MLNRWSFLKTGFYEGINLSTHHPALLYRVFEPKEAKRLIAKLEIHYTPKHGSWLNMIPS